jgi:hypothetical protein
MIFKGKGLTEAPNSYILSCVFDFLGSFPFITVRFSHISPHDLKLGIEHLEYLC